MKYRTIVCRYEDDAEIPAIEIDDVIAGGEITDFKEYDAIHAGNLAIGGVTDRGLLDAIAAVIAPTDPR